MSYNEEQRQKKSRRKDKKQNIIWRLMLKKIKGEIYQTYKIGNKQKSNSQSQNQKYNNHSKHRAIYKWLVITKSQHYKKKPYQTSNKQKNRQNPTHQPMFPSPTQQKQTQQQKQSQIKYMQTILEHPIIQLERLKNRQLINLKTNISKLKYFVDFMRYRLYLDFNSDDGKGPKIESQEASKRVANELEKLCPVYFHLIVDRLVGDKYKPYDPLLLKLRPSPYETHSYFMNFHDLQALGKIQPQPAIDSIEFYMKQVRKVVFLQPKRQTMQQDARKKWQQFNQQIQTNPQISQKQKFTKRFTQYPSESEGYTEEEMQQVLYSIDDLEIDFDGYERDEEEEEEEERRKVGEIRRFMQGSFARLDELERGMVAGQGEEEEREEEEEEEVTFW